MPTAKKPRNKGVTYKLVPRSYGDADAEEGPMWVSEAEFYRNHQNPAPAEEEDKARRQFNMYAAAANAEFSEARRQQQQQQRRPRTEGNEDDDYAGDEGEEGEYYEDEEEGEWMDGDWEEEEEWEEEGEEGEWEEAQPPPAVKAPPPPPAAAASAAPVKGKTVGFNLQPTAASAAPRPREEKRRRDEVEAESAEGQDDDDDGERGEVGEREAEEEEEVGDEKLFDDEVECEVTDDFLRQLVFGGAGGADNNDGDDDFMMDGDGEGEEEDWDGLDEEDGEMWRLLTDEEKAAIRASRRRGTARRRRVVAGDGDATRTHAADGTEYPTHDVTQRAIDRQFTEMMREFNADARLNDAYTDDPRTYGALPMEKYMAALEEFVTDRAGMDVETAEPHKNKGLIQQLKYLAHHAGAFDSDAHGTFLTTTLPEKQQRFVEEFVKGTEEIRRAARQRVAQRERAAAAAALVTGAPSSSAVPVGEGAEEEEEEQEEMIVLEVKPKVDRLDCETAVSAYSTYYNQPNVITAPRKSNPNRRGNGSKKTVVKGNVISAAGTSASSGVAAERTKTAGRAAKSANNNNDDGDDREDEESDDEKDAVAGSRAPGKPSLDVIPTVRVKGETKEEKKLRRQAVKEAQRERRQAKSALKSMYKDVESEEVKRNATSQAARRTVHFM